MKFQRSKVPNPDPKPTRKTFKELAQENNRAKAAETRERLLEKQRKADHAAEEEVMDMIYGPPKKEDDEAAE